MKNPKANVVRAIRTNKANVPADLQSVGNEYQNRRSAQLICDPKYIPIFSIISLHRETFRFIFATQHIPS